MLTRDPPAITNHHSGPASAPAQAQVQTLAADAHLYRFQPEFSNFSKQFQAVTDSLLTIRSGDTLIGIVRAQALAQGLKLSARQEFQLAQQLANANQIRNPNLIQAGHKINTGSLQQEWAALQHSKKIPSQLTPLTQVAPIPREVAGMFPAALSLAQRAALEGVAHPSPSSSTPKLQAPLKVSEHPVLERTLVRAVAKGFIPPAEKNAVFNKILQMAQAYQFSPDDFARMTLMESDGMNPRASNQRCHGIIQFCDGPARGAASTGYGAHPRSILDLSVQQQLNLVDKYFADVGLKNQGPAGLEDLYLSVLNPASRSEVQATSPLNIQGKQSRLLHTDSDRNAPITRQSIRLGLLQNAAERLDQWQPQSLRPAQQRAQLYAKNQTP